MINLDKDKTYTQLNEYFPYNANMANYLIHISNKYNYIYFETPKVACSTIKRTLQRIEIINTNCKLSDNIHDKQASPLLSPLSIRNELIFHIEKKFKFSFVRNPYSRILSCYLDKIIGSQWEKNIRLPQLGYKPNAKLSFEEFLKAVKQYKYLDMDIHWMPQSILLSEKKIDLDFIGKQETFNQDFEKILAKIQDKSVKKILMSNEQSHSVNASEKLNKYLNNRIIQLIQEIYYNDFKSYAYGFDPDFI